MIQAGYTGPRVPIWDQYEPFFMNFNQIDQRSIKKLNQEARYPTKFDLATSEREIEGFFE